MSKKIRFSTLVRDYGPVQHALAMRPKAWRKAWDEGRTATVYHADDGDWCAPVIALVRRAGFVNTICKIAWAKPLPDDVTEIIGMRDNPEAWDLCHQSHR